MPTVTTVAFREQSVAGQINLSTDTYYVALLGSQVYSNLQVTLASLLYFEGFTPFFQPALSAWEVSSTTGGYTAGGVALTGSSNPSIDIQTDSTGTVVQLMTNNVIWNGVTFTPYGCVIYKPNPPQSPILGFIDFGNPNGYPTVNGTFSIAWNQFGLLNQI